MGDFYNKIRHAQYNSAFLRKLLGFSIKKGKSTKHSSGLYAVLRCGTTVPSTFMRFLGCGS